jgi:predicted nucleic acid-binding protein
LIALDTNILIYAAQTNEPAGRDIQSISLMERLGIEGAIVPLQVVGEFINACRRKKIASLADASIRASLWLELYDCTATKPKDYIEATQHSDKHGLQYFDALIITVAARAGATLLLSEDMHDGLEVGGLRIVNPFAAANDALLADYFGSMG